jgi:hypothetical protein
MKKTILFTFLLLLSLLSNAQDIMNNQSILDLMDLGFESEVIKAKINSSPVEFDTSMEQLKFLKEKGVSSDVLALMIDKSKAEIESGVSYYKNNELEKIQPSVFAGTAVSNGVVSTKIKSYVNGLSSSNKINSNNLVFIFQFDNENKNDLGSENWWFKAASSPSEFALTKLQQKKNRRVLVTGKVNVGGVQIGVDTKDTIEFSIEDLGNGKYKVTLNNALELGEYCFFYQGTIPMGGYNNQSIFDFSVQ